MVFTSVSSKGGPHASDEGWCEAVPGVINTLLDRVARSCLFQFSSHLSHFVEEKDLI